MTLPKSREDVIKYATMSAECTHNHQEGIKGAVVTATCGWMAKNGASKKEIEEYASREYPARSYYKYPVSMSMKELREVYKWDETCQGSVPAQSDDFLDSEDYESFIRNVLSFKCDSDNIRSYRQDGIAEEFYKDTGFNNDELLKKYLDERLYGIVKESK